MLYEDKIIKVELPQTPAAKGHLVITSSAAKFDLLDPDSAAHVLSAASFSSNLIFEAAHAHGTNIILTDLDGVRCDVVARTEGDGINFDWTPLQLPPDELDKISDKIKDKCDYIGVKEEKAPKIDKDSKEDDKKSQGKKVISGNADDWVKEKNYLLRQLDRIP